MRTIREVLAHKGRQVWTIDPDATVFDAIGQMAARNVGALVVMEGARMLGIISEREYVRCVALQGRSCRDTRVRQIMRGELPVIGQDAGVDRCMTLMTEQRTRHLPVMAGSELVGLVSIGDLVAAVIAEQQAVIADLAAAAGRADGPDHRCR